MPSSRVCGEFGVRILFSFPPFPPRPRPSIGERPEVQDLARLNIISQVIVIVIISCLSRIRMLWSIFCVYCCNSPCRWCPYAQACRSPLVSQGDAYTMKKREKRQDRKGHPAPCTMLVKGHAPLLRELRANDGQAYKQPPWWKPRMF